MLHNYYLDIKKKAKQYMYVNVKLNQLIAMIDIKILFWKIISNLFAILIYGNTNDPLIKRVFLMKPIRIAPIGHTKKT